MDAATWLRNDVCYLPVLSCRRLVLILSLGLRGLIRPDQSRLSQHCNGTIITGKESSCCSLMLCLGHTKSLVDLFLSSCGSVSRVGREVTFKVGTKIVGKATKCCLKRDVAVQIKLHWGKKSNVIFPLFCCYFSLIHKLLVFSWSWTSIVFVWCLCLPASFTREQRVTTLFFTLKNIPMAHQHKLNILKWNLFA